jgi:hypothetical protein
MFDSWLQPFFFPDTFYLLPYGLHRSAKWVLTRLEFDPLVLQVGSVLLLRESTGSGISCKGQDGGGHTQASSWTRNCRAAVELTAVARDTHA